MSPVLPFPAPPPPPKKKKFSALWIILPIVVCVVPVLFLLGLGGLGYLYSKSGKEIPATEQDRALVVDASALADRVPSLKLDAKKEQFKKEKDPFGSVTVSYEYEDQGAPLYVKSSVSFENKASDAKTAYGAARLGLQGYFAATGKLQTVARDDLLTWGDESESSLLTRNGKPVGNFFIARKGGRVFMLMVAGLYFDDPEIMSEVILPRLEAMDRHVVSK